MTSWDIAAIAAVLLVGVPHGGFDGAVARRLGWSKGIGGWLGFHLGYLALAAGVVWLWVQWPVVSLAIFLAISALHFGHSDIADVPAPTTGSPSNRWLPLIAHGGLVSIAIPSLQPLAVQPIFALLVGDEAAVMLLQAIRTLFLPWLLSFAGYAIYAVINPVWRKSLNSLIILLIVVFLMPPLISFALYFCLWHSRGHTLRTWHRISAGSERRRSAIEAIIYSVMAWTAALVFFLYAEASLSASLLQLTFIGLAALTVPHMLLVDLADKLNPQRPLP
jgi:Brp/Blh family beta-carotene 15,15'-monooxygenase